MKKTLGLVCFIFFAFLSKGQNFSERWALDSVQIKETSIDGFIEKTITANGRWKFDEFWMLEFAFSEDRKAVEATMNDGNKYVTNLTISEEGRYTMDFMGGIQIYSITFGPLSSQLLLEDSYSGTYKSEQISGTRKYYYSKIK